MPLYLGIDAGGTKTDSAISNGAELLGQATGASCKITRVGETEARKNLLEAITRACDSARIKPQQIARVCLGITGASLPGTISWAQKVIGELVPGEVSVMGDNIIAHRAAFGAMPGVLIIAGTGSIAYGRNEKGETGRAGGWGPAVSDEGSALWIGREAVAAALRARDSGTNNGLLNKIAAAWSIPVEEVIRVANTCNQPRLAELAEMVARSADQGDAIALGVVTRAGKELAALVSIVMKQLWPQNMVVRVAMAGGVLQGSALVRRTFHDALQSAQPNASISVAYVRPVLGALAIAAAPHKAQ